MEPSASKSVVMITGAAGGLGAVLVAAFAVAGWQVVAGWHRKLVPLDCSAEGIHPIRLDVTDPESVTNGFLAMRDRFGHLDALINAAGVTADGSIVNLGVIDWDSVIEVNLRGAARCCQSALQFFPGDAGGHIVNVGSLAGKIGRSGQANYAAAKAGLIGFSKAMAREMGSRSIRINVVLPGVMATPMTATLSQEDLGRLRDENVLRCLNDPVEIARFIVFLVGTRTISGQVFNLDSRISP
ncbi:MAG: SDR family NAD(P)-dependent oxidoreductase [Pedosphaera sp.]|nr:SDR family NAD(P)-dependent oxidoreductase [Pedosphaera sp.]